MLNELADAHAFMITAGGDLYKSIDYSPVQAKLAEQLGLSMDDPNWIAEVDEQLEQAGFNIIDNYLTAVEMLVTDQIIWGQFSDNTGYLALRSMNFDGEDDVSNLAAANQVINDLSSRLANFDNLIIDLRFNLGGNVPAALRLADYLAMQSAEAFVINFKTASGFMENHVHSVTPSATGFTGNIYLLVSSQTGSAAEAFIYAMKSGNQVQLIGENTRGILSGPSPKLLANGWTVMVPNRRITDLDENILENIGFTPDVEIEAFRIDSINQQKDDILDYIKSL